jgi:hypothetical protein
MGMVDAVLAGLTVVLSAALAMVGAAATWMSRSIIRHEREIGILSSRLDEYQKTNAARLDAMEANNAVRHGELRDDLKELSAVVVQLHRNPPRPSPAQGPRTAPPTDTPDAP